MALVVQASNPSHTRETKARRSCVLSCLQRRFNTSLSSLAKSGGKKYYKKSWEGMVVQPASSVSGKQRQEDHKFETLPDYVVRTYLKNKQNLDKHIILQCNVKTIQERIGLWGHCSGPT